MEDKGGQMTKEELFHLQIPECSEGLYHKIKENWNQVAKPLDGLGRMEDMICTIGTVQQTESPRVTPRRLVILCADNGIVEEGVSQSGQEVTLAVAKNMGMRKSSVCKMAEKSGTDVITVDIGINSEEEIPGVRCCKVRKGTRNFLKEPAMTEEELLQAVETGISIVRECRDQGYQILATGEMGIGNTTTSTAVAAAILGLDPELVTGRGAGLSQKGLLRKTEVIRQGLMKYSFEEFINGKAAAQYTIAPKIVAQNSNLQVQETDKAQAEAQKTNQLRAWEALRCLGGLDIAGLCGVFIGGALYQIPVVIDGVISAAAALCAARILPGQSPGRLSGVQNFMLASHVGAEPAMQSILKELGLQGVIHADLALGEGTGAVMLFPLLEMALEVYQDSNSFADIGMEQYERFI